MSDETLAARAEPDLAYDRFRAVRHFGSLDAMRCLAIVAVIWQHCPPVPHGTTGLADIGASGVSLFFVLSGFLITTLLLREAPEVSGIGLRDFYIRRALRIFPLYYAVLGLYTALVLLFERNAAGDLFLRNLPFYLTYTNNWFVDLAPDADGRRRVIFIFAWTLATEEQFYMLWPPLLCLLGRARAAAALAGVVAVTLWALWTWGPLDVPVGSGERLVRILQSPSVQICAGVFLAMALDSRRLFRILHPLLGRSWSSPAAAAISAALLFWPSDATTGWFVLLSLAFSAFIGSCVIREDHGLARWCRPAVLRRIGVVSYGMYLLHMLAVNAVRAVMSKAGVESAPLAFALAVLLAWAAAEVSFRCFERPFLRLKDRFRRHAGSGRESEATGVIPVAGVAGGASR
ncbi:MAG: acyltransferase [Phycisphaerae bacterium]